MVRVIMFVVFVCVPGWVMAQPLPTSPDCRINRSNQSCEAMAKKYGGILGGSCTGARCQKIGMVWTCNLGIGFVVTDEPEAQLSIAESPPFRTPVSDVPLNSTSRRIFSQVSA